MSQKLKLKGKLAFIMGGGKFGTKALRCLSIKGAKVLVVDINPSCSAKFECNIQAQGLEIVNSLVDGQTAFLVNNAVESLLILLEIRVPDLIVTAMPGNTISEFVKYWIKKKGLKYENIKSVISKLLENIPNSLVSFFDEESAIIVVSYMSSSMLCKENCVPPKDICASTGRPKLVSIDRLLKFSIYGFSDVSAVLVSRQLKGGLGAIYGIEIMKLLEKLEKTPKPFTLAIGTACDCHGIINFIKIKKI